MNVFASRATFPAVKTLRLKTMAQATLDIIKANAAINRGMIADIKVQVEDLSKKYNVLRAAQLREENAKLLAAVEQAKARLVQAEIANGIPQIPVPGQKITCCKPEPASSEVKQEEKPVKVKAEKVDRVDKPKKEKKPKEEQLEAAIDIGRLDLRIANILEVQRHPDADTLYLLKINCGEEKLRTVCSGLVKHIPMEELQNRSVMLLCNLKPVKMRGIMSEAMVMCASTTDKVEVLSPPEGALPGDLVDCEGYTRQPDAVMNPKKKIFETVAPDLHTNEQLEACYKGVPLRVATKGQILAQTLKNVAVK